MSAHEPSPVSIDSISAVTLFTHDMAHAVRFYSALGFSLKSGGKHADFTSFHAGSSYLNLMRRSDSSWGPWGRVIFYVSDPDALYGLARSRGLEPDFAPRYAHWGERYFHIKDPDGHELSFARPGQ